MFPKLSGLKSLHRMKKRIDYKVPFLVLLLLFACLAEASAQTRKELEDKRRKIIKDIAATEKMIQKTKANKDATYDRFLALQNQIASRETLIQTLQDEVTATDQDISRNEAVIASLEQDVVKMRNDYGKTVRRAFRQKTISNPLLYILSAESLNQAFRRWLFVRKYDERRREQAKAIAETQQMLQKRNSELESTRSEKEDLLNSMQGQKTSLSNELTEKNDLLKFLSKDEARLKSDLEQKQAAHEAMNRAIENIISEEVQKRAEEARARPKPEASPPPGPVATKETAPENSAKAEKNTAVAATSSPAENLDYASSAFAKNRGRLPWPVESGFISRGFGRQKHPTLKNIEITNNGIDIRTEENASVRAVYDGKVAGTQYIPGHDYTVIIQHGDYYTVYSNLSETSLSKGDPVRARQVIGSVSTNPITGSSELHFELWYQKDRQNPALWIKK